MTASNTKSDTPTPHRHTTRVAHSPSLATRHGADHTGELPAVHAPRHRRNLLTPKARTVAGILAQHAGQR